MSLGSFVSPKREVSLSFPSQQGGHKSWVSNVTNPEGECEEQMLPILQKANCIFCASEQLQALPTAVPKTSQNGTGLAEWG